MNNIQEYRRELEALAVWLKPFAHVVEIRGDDLAQFVFVSKHGKSIEISRHENGIWAEFWNGDSELPAHEQTFLSYEQVITAVKEWLTNEQG